MQLTRREFGKASLLNILLIWFVGFTSMLLTGCPKTIDEVLTDLEAWVPTVINTAQSILNLLAPFIPQVGAAAALIATITGLVKSILATIKEYQTADPATKTTLLGKIRDWLQAISDNLTGFVSGLKLSGNPIVKGVGVLLGVIVSAITGYINLLPIMQGAKSKTLAASVTVGGERFAVKPKLMDRGSFLNTWNAQANQLGHPEACVYEKDVKATEDKLKAAKN